MESEGSNGITRVIKGYRRGRHLMASQHQRGSRQRRSTTTTSDGITKEHERALSWRCTPACRRARLCQSRKSGDGKLSSCSPPLVWEAVPGYFRPLVQGHDSAEPEAHPRRCRVVY